MSEQITNKVNEYIEKYELKSLIECTTNQKSSNVFESVEPNRHNICPPAWDDLVRLHNIILDRKVTNILEFGCGFSSLIMAHALSINSSLHGDFVKNNLRRASPFQLMSVDDLETYIETTKSRVPLNLKNFCHFHFSSTRMGEFNGRICTFYEQLPNITPDFIYLDGPSQYSVQGDVSGINTRHPDRVPMAGDLLKIEHYLLPGTLIVVDGRTANARFLLKNFQRDWHYFHSEKEDVHFFELREKPLGKYNLAQIKFCLGEEWPHNSDFEKYL